jgi:NAD(P)-dependent dehydrogenase (short-subunit alcohol dehydrogenase family)
VAEFEGKVAVVTGAASGIGRGVAVALASNGAHVVLVDRDAGRLQQARDELPPLEQGSAEIAAVDVTEPGAVRVLNDTAQRFGRVDILVNSAGSTSKHSFLDLPLAAWDDMFDVHVKATFVWTQEAARHMAVQRAGTIVNLSSIAAEQANSMAVHYAAAKGAVKMLTRGAAVALAPFGVRVNAVAPGTTRTPLTEQRLEKAEVLAATLERVPAGRLAEVADIVNAVLFLASERSSYIAGQTLIVDGGWTSQLYGSSYADVQMSGQPTSTGVVDE